MRQEPIPLEELPHIEVVEDLSVPSKSAPEITGRDEHQIEVVFTPVDIQLNLAGRLRNLGNGKLKYWWMAIAEAVNNAFDSIQDSGTTGTVSLIVERELDLVAQGGGEGVIKNVIVRDNGSGFNEDNFRSFSTPDSLRKLHKGGKGVGRLLCLQAFNNVYIHSEYLDEDFSYRRREIKWQRESPCLSAKPVVEIERGEWTNVHLNGLLPEHNSMAGAPLERIVEWMTEQFLPVLLEKPRWLSRFTVIDGSREIDLIQHISSSSVWIVRFEIKSQIFTASCYALHEQSSSDKVRLVAAGRVVQANTRDLEHYVSHLATVADDKAHVILIQSEFFNENVNDARNGVSFSEEDNDGLMGITNAMFKEALSSNLRGVLAERVEKATIKMRQKVEAVIRKENPAYRPLLMAYWESKEFANLRNQSSTEDIMVSIDTFKRKDAQKLRKTSRRILKLSNETSEYWEAAQKLTDNIEAHKKTVLAEYISLRRILLERLEKILGLNSEGNRHKEAEIHNLIFPQRADTESSPGADHQLWILDERLESHRYLASDQPLDGKKGDRPDLLLGFDNPAAFVSEPFSTAAGYERVVIIEFKRGLEDLSSVSTDSLPHRQMMRYANQIVNGKAVHSSSGRPIKTTSNARFYMYAICDLPRPLLERLERDEHFTQSATGDGAFSVITSKGTNYYMEYISLEKVLEDAKARNNSFFKKLGID